MTSRIAEQDSLEGLRYELSLIGLALNATGQEDAAKTIGRAIEAADTLSQMRDALERAEFWLAENTPQEVHNQICAALTTTNDGKE